MSQHPEGVPEPFEKVRFRDPFRVVPFGEYYPGVSSLRSSTPG